MHEDTNFKDSDSSQSSDPSVYFVFCDLCSFTCVKHNVYSPLKALSHGAIFPATCNAILLLGDVNLANTSFHHRLLI